MNPSFTIFGIHLYWYGLLIGAAIAISLVLTEWRARRASPLLLSFFEHWGLVVIAGGFIGARAWHVLTDLPRYITNWSAIIYVWNGGLSIIGAVFGGLLTIALLRMVLPELRMLHRNEITDALIFGVPIGQMIGRLGNWINQELYGLPTNLPWGIPIAPQNRLTAYAAYETYHPLFAYESIALAAFAIWLYWYDRRHPKQFGIGLYTWMYLVFYCSLRFLLDFIRIDKPSLIFGLGFNQLVLLAVLIVVVLFRKMVVHEVKT